MICSKQATVFPRSVKTFKITGWSVRHTGYSLLESLATAGQIVSFVNYPQLNSSYVTFNKPNRQFNMIYYLRSFLAPLQVDAVTSSPLEGLVNGLECPSTTAFFSSRTFVSENEIYSTLQKFGSLRALSITYSVKSQKWLCKATFYEKYSLDRLIGHQTSVFLKFANGMSVRVQRVSVDGQVQTVINGRHYSNGSSPTSNLCGQTSFVKSALGNVNKINQQIHDTVINHHKYKKSAASSSCSRERKVVLPSPTVFKSAELHLENILCIVKSHKNESTSSRVGRLVSSTRRATSLDGSRVKSEVKINVSPLDIKRTTGSIAWPFDEKELYFVQLKKSNKSRAYVSHYASHIERGTTDLKATASYLSTDDLSDGYSAEESPEVYEPLCTWTNQAQSGKNISLVPLTKYSSGSELSEEKHESCHYKNNFDTYLGSFSEQLYQEAIPSGQKNGEYNYTKPTIDYFSFPCY